MSSLGEPYPKPGESRRKTMQAPESWNRLL
jgi:hypothetical protein